MRQPREPLYLARRSYRRRRLIDALRLVPLLGALLFLIPAMKMSGSGGSTLWGGIYLFLTWLGLIVLTAFLSYRASRAEGSNATDLSIEDPD